MKNNPYQYTRTEVADALEIKKRLITTWTNGLKTYLKGHYIQVKEENNAYYFDKEALALFQIAKKRYEEHGEDVRAIRKYLLQSDIRQGSSTPPKKVVKESEQPSKPVVDQIVQQAPLKDSSEWLKEEAKYIKTIADLEKNLATVSGERDVAKKEVLLLTDGKSTEERITEKKLARSVQLHILSLTGELKSLGGNVFLGRRRKQIIAELASVNKTGEMPQKGSSVLDSEPKILATVLITLLVIALLTTTIGIAYVQYWPSI